jgi:hypothetical protein
MNPEKHTLEVIRQECRILDAEIKLMREFVGSIERLRRAHSERLKNAIAERHELGKSAAKLDFEINQP